LGKYTGIGGNRKEVSRIFHKEKRAGAADAVAGSFFVSGGTGRVKLSGAAVDKDDCANDHGSGDKDI
jgi:hypothetical protein